MSMSATTTTTTAAAILRIPKRKATPFSAPELHPTKVRTLASPTQESPSPAATRGTAAARPLAMSPR